MTSPRPAPIGAPPSCPPPCLPPLGPLLAPLGASAAGIEAAFLKAGDGLSEGLGLFEALAGSLKGLADDLAGGATAAASTTLDDLSRALVAISASLPADAAVLRELVDSNQAIASQFADLIDNMRMMTIIARSARIEAVVFDEERLGLESFACDIGRRTQDVARDIHACAADHAKLTAVLKDIARRQFDLDTAFRDRLLVLAAELGAAFALIRAKREDTLAFMTGAAARSDRILQAVGMALMALQIGDTTRQRLDHVAEATRWAIALAEGDEEADHDVPDEARAATARSLCRLGDAQLRDTLACFDGETGRILDALRLLGEETQALIRSGQATFGEAGGGSESFLSGFLARFAAARDLVRTCEAARLSVERTLADVRAMLDGLNGTIATLTHTSLDLVLVGMNAGLKAAKLGPEGHSFVVVANELKRLAGEISRHAQSLRPVLATVQAVAGRLDRAAAAGAPGTSDLDHAIAALVDDLGQGDRKIAALLAAMGRTGRTFEGKLARATRDFEGAAALGDTLLHTADALADAAHTPLGDHDQQAAAAYATALILPAYSMAQERTVHAATLGPTPQPHHTPATPETDTDIDLWAA